uniref:Uncharacterized protein n=1 Tax=Corethron hystrix TaxID=216773 RepID=A0A7S1BW12_9STRA|mmetsp:Transcript_43220/g.101339  ORF Transcript_43220/g.101339 Transcript_43220/m.101339 type:complete len:307 (+) Transcript_43220:552-1472(+)
MAFFMSCPLHHCPGATTIFPPTNRRYSQTKHIENLMCRWKKKENKQFQSNRLDWKKKWKKSLPPTPPSHWLNTSTTKNVTGIPVVVPIPSALQFADTNPQIPHNSFTLMEDDPDLIKSTVSNAKSTDSFQKVNISIEKRPVSFKNNNSNTPQTQSTEQCMPLSQPSYGQDPNCSVFSFRSVESEISYAESVMSTVDWTPQDSSYGAACPVCGCLPKRYRRLIEASLCIFLLFSLIASVVMLSIRLTEDVNKNSQYVKQDIYDDVYTRGHYNVTVYDDDAANDDTDQDDALNNDNYFNRYYNGDDAN